MLHSITLKGFHCQKKSTSMENDMLMFCFVLNNRPYLARVYSKLTQGHFYVVQKMSFQRQRKSWQNLFLRYSICSSLFGFGERTKWYRVSNTQRHGWVIREKIGIEKLGFRGPGSAGTSTNNIITLRTRSSYETCFPIMHLVSCFDNS